MERLVLKNCKQLLTAGANYHLYSIDGERKVYVFSLGTRIGLSVDYVGAYPVSGQFKMIENEDDGTISFTSYKSSSFYLISIAIRNFIFLATVL